MKSRFSSRIFFFVVVVACVLVLSIHAGMPSDAAPASAWRSRVIYQLLTDRFSPGINGSTPCTNLSDYCGGTYSGILQNLDYLQGLGVDAIWISPIVKNSPKGYHGYWLQDLYALNPNFGPGADLSALVKACHNRGMFVMVDVVVNHVAPVGFDYSSINPFNQANHYHSYCTISDWNNQQQVEFCRLADLPDLAQENEFVASTFNNWIKSIVQNFGFDGIRIDTVPEVPKWYWPQFAASSGVYQLGEVFNGRVDYVASYQQVLDGVFSYPLFFTLRGVFGSHESMNNIQSLLRDQYPSAFKDLSLLGVMVDNHDNARFLSFQPDHVLYKNALAFSILTEGIPVIYYGSEQGFNGGNDPLNRETLWDHYNTQSDLYVWIRKVINIRKQYQLWNTNQIQRFSDDTFYAFTRANLFVAFTNVGSQGGVVQRTISYHPYSNGQRLCNVFDSSDCTTVSNNQFSVSLMNGMCKFLYPA